MPRRLARLPCLGVQAVVQRLGSPYRFKNHGLVVLSSWSTWGGGGIHANYVQGQSTQISLTKIIISLCLLTSIDHSRLLSIKTPTPFLFAVVLVYQSLKPIFSTYFDPSI
jgi:hypothetical protein